MERKQQHQDVLEVLKRFIDANEGKAGATMFLSKKQIVALHGELLGCRRRTERLRRMVVTWTGLSHKMDVLLNGKEEEAVIYE
jgi:hypothetical protein